MPEISPSISPGISNRKLQVRPCIMCGGTRDMVVAYTTNQGKRSQRHDPRCRECSKERRRALHDRDREHSRAVCRDWGRRNAEYRSEYYRRRQQDPEVRALKAYHQRLRKARMRSGSGDNDEIREIYRRAKYIERMVSCCPVFDLPELGKQMQVDHIVPLSKGGKHEAFNLQILPIGLNMRKGVSIRA